jgi:hypothetical protein
VLRYALVRKPVSTEGEETQAGPPLLLISTVGMGSPEVETVTSLDLPFHRRADAWARNIQRQWAESGGSSLEGFTDLITATYGPEYVVVLQGTSS